MEKRKLALSGTIFLVASLLFAFGLVLTSCGEPDPPPPQPECDDDLDCPAEKLCQSGRCVNRAPKEPPPECYSNGDCPDNKVCVSGKCKIECESDTDCVGGKVCDSNRCIEVACEVQTVYFDFDQYYLTSEAQSTLRENADCLKKKKVSKVVVEGHCDERGTAEYNLSLGQKRAQAVRDFLVDLGIDSTGVKILSYGEERPAEYGHDEDAWTKNRRSETKID